LFAFRRFVSYYLEINELEVAQITQHGHNQGCALDNFFINRIWCSVKLRRPVHQRVPDDADSTTRPIQLLSDPQHEQSHESLAYRHPPLFILQGRRFMGLVHSLTSLELWLDFRGHFGIDQ